MEDLITEGKSGKSLSKDCKKKCASKDDDEDIEDKFEFSVTGGDIDLFGIITNEVGGVIQVLQNNKLDFEGGNLEYTIDIMLSDLGILVEKECRRTNPGHHYTFIIRSIKSSIRYKT